MQYSLFSNKQAAAITGLTARLTALLISSLLILPGCSNSPDDPETEIKSMLTLLELAAEERSISGVSGFLATDYHDRHHRNSQAVKRSLLGYFRRNRSIHLFSNIKQVKVNETDDSLAQATVHVAMTGTQVDSEQALLTLRANLYQFSLELAKPGDQWLVSSANWKKIKLTEF